MPGSMRIGRRPPPEAGSRTCGARRQHRRARRRRSQGGGGALWSTREFSIESYRWLTPQAGNGLYISTRTKPKRASLIRGNPLFSTQNVQSKELWMCLEAVRPPDAREAAARQLRFFETLPPERRRKVLSGPTEDRDGHDLHRVRKSAPSARLSLRPAPPSP